MANALRIDVSDNVAVALRELPEGMRVSLAENGAEMGVCTQEPVPFGHKIALTDIPQGTSITKYGASIGLASQDIAPGQHVHIHNLRSVRGAAR